jgi:hypothetical protein
VVWEAKVEREVLVVLVVLEARGAQAGVAAARSL